MEKPNCNILARINPKILEEFNALVKMLVVATDKQNNFEYFNQLSTFLTENQNIFEKSEKKLTMCYLFLCADHSQLIKGKRLVISLNHCFKISFKTFFKIECLF